MTAIEEAKKAALEDAKSKLHGFLGDDPRAYAAASIDAFLFHLSELGYVVVPKEASEEMIEAGRDSGSWENDMFNVSSWTIQKGYAAMIAASPDHRQSQQEDGK